MEICNVLLNLWGQPIQVALREKVFFIREKRATAVQKGPWVFTEEWCGDITRVEYSLDHPMTCPRFLCSPFRSCFLLLFFSLSCFSLLLSYMRSDEIKSPSDESSESLALYTLAQIGVQSLWGRVKRGYPPIPSFVYRSHDIGLDFWLVTDICI